MTGNNGRQGGFNTQPPEGGWKNGKLLFIPAGVSTHSRLKAAGISISLTDKRGFVSTHSRLKAAGAGKGGE